MIRTVITGFWALLGTSAVVDAAELSVGANTIQKLIAEQLFNKQGRWYLQDDGPCYVYLEYPKTRLAAGRIFLDAHLSSRVGARIGGYCAGSGFASNVTLSGQLIGNGSTLTLNDIRIDHLDDGATRTVIGLVQTVAPQVLPKALSLDVLASVRGAPINAAVPVTLLQFRILDIATGPAAVVVRFDLSLSTP
ncbi:MAG: hypothetical protein JWO52_5350 [Gammaproteobacteria bacterium]|nr:hypothetical protein [Gammaproteobacteria bacterium]